MTRISLAFICLIILSSCQEEAEVKLPLNSAGNCHQELMIVDTIERSQGKIISNTAITPAIYGIELSAPRQTGQYQIRILIPCNLPDAFKKVGQSVIISGRMLTYGKDTESRMDIYGQPFEITAVGFEE